MLIALKTSGMFETAHDPIDMGVSSILFSPEVYRIQQSGGDYHKAYQRHLRALDDIQTLIRSLRHKTVGVTKVTREQAEILQAVVDLDDESLINWLCDGYDVSDLPLKDGEPEVGPYEAAEATLRKFLTDSKATYTEDAFSVMWGEIVRTIAHASIPRA